MRLDRRFVVVVTVSLGWALVVSVIFYRLAGRGKAPQAASAGRTIVVATQPLEIGSVIRAEQVKLSQVPESVFPRGGFERIEDVVGRPVISPIQPQEPVVEARMAARGSAGGVSPLIPPGMRAVAVRVNDVAGVAGFVLPGMRVDILVTGSPPGGDDRITRTVLQNITVLSVGQTVQVDAKSQAINAPVVTLLVSPAQAEALTLANSEGRIQLVLRNSSDQQVLPTEGKQLSELYGQRQTALPAAAAPPRAKPTVPAPAPRPVSPEPAVAAPAPPEEVLMIRGNQRSLEPLRPAQSGSK